MVGVWLGVVRNSVRMTASRDSSLSLMLGVVQERYDHLLVSPCV